MRMVFSERADCAVKKKGDCKEQRRGVEGVSVWMEQLGVDGKAWCGLNGKGCGSPI